MNVPSKIIVSQCHLLLLLSLLHTIQRHYNCHNKSVVNVSTFFEGVHTNKQTNIQKSKQMFLQKWLCHNVNLCSSSACSILYRDIAIVIINQSWMSQPSKNNGLLLSSRGDLPQFMTQLFAEILWFFNFRNEISMS